MHEDQVALSTAEITALATRSAEEGWEDLQKSIPLVQPYQGKHQ